MPPCVISPGVQRAWVDLKLARDGRVEAVPGSARRGVFGGAPLGWLTIVSGGQPAYPVYNTEADEGLRPFDPRKRDRGGRKDVAPPQPPPGRAGAGGRDALSGIDRRARASRCARLTASTGLLRFLRNGLGNRLGSKRQAPEVVVDARVVRILRIQESVHRSPNGLRDRLG